MRKERNAENGSKMLENLKIQKTLYVIKNFNVANEQIWKKLFRKIICFGPWCINVDSIQFIMFLFLSFVQPNWSLVTNLLFISFNYYRNSS